MALQMKPLCERCERGLAMDGEALICSFECTFCAACAETMARRCPNCGGELVARPRREVSRAGAWGAAVLEGRTRVRSGKRGVVRVRLGGRREIKKKTL